MKNIVILISGGGSNMKAIVQHAQQQAWEANGLARIAAVVSNRAGAAGLAFAQEQGIPTVVLSHKDFASREAYDAALMAIGPGVIWEMVTISANSSIESQPKLCTT